MPGPAPRTANIHQTSTTQASIRTEATVAMTAGDRSVYQTSTTGRTEIKVITTLSIRYATKRVPNGPGATPGGSPATRTAGGAWSAMVWTPWIPGGGLGVAASPPARWSA